jgi:hypothetical protein
VRFLRSLVCRVHGLGFKVRGLGRERTVRFLRGLVCRVHGLGFKVHGLGRERTVRFLKSFRRLFMWSNCRFPKFEMSPKPSVSDPLLEPAP